MIKDLHINPHDKEFMDMNTGEKIIWRTEQYHIPHVLVKEEVLEQLRKKIADVDKKENKRIIRFPQRYYYLAASAAAVLILVSTWFLWNNKPLENIVAEKGYQKDYRLPDGTMVSLNADSKISFNKGNFHKKREVFLEGEAFFNVEKGSPFTISTNHADIKILGTSFNVFSREDQFKVSCFTGKILVKSGSESVTIVPHESAYLDQNTLAIRHENTILSNASWRVGEFSYENSSLKIVFDELERQFNINFVFLTDINDKSYTGGFNNKNLIDALDLTCIPMGLTYEIGSNSKVLIKNKSQ